MKRNKKYYGLNVPGKNLKIKRHLDKGFKIATIKNSVQIKKNVKD